MPRRWTAAVSPLRDSEFGVIADCRENSKIPEFRAGNSAFLPLPVVAIIIVLLIPAIVIIEIIII